MLFLKTDSCSLNIRLITEEDEEKETDSSEGKKFSTEKFKLCMILFKWSSPDWPTKSEAIRIGGTKIVTNETTPAAINEG